MNASQIKETQIFRPNETVHFGQVQKYIVKRSRASAHRHLAEPPVSTPFQTESKKTKTLHNDNSMKICSIINSTKATPIPTTKVLLLSLFHHARESG